MKASRSATAALTVVIAVSSWAFVGARQAGQLPLEPLGNKGEALFPYLEGWYTNPDGTVSFLLGYMNRNTKQSFEIPVGPNNRIEPGNLDQGQPTVFNTGRNNRMFTITVPKDFGANRKITWTLVANKITQSVSFWQNPPYFVEPFIATGTGNTPPVIKIDGGPDHSGPPRGIAKTYTGTVGQPLTLTVWAADKGNTIVLDPNPPQRGAGGGGGGGRGARGGAAADPGAAGAAPDAGRGGAAADAGRGGAAADAGRGGAAAAGRGGRGAAAPAGPPAVVQIAWARYRGPAEVKFADERLPIANREGQTVSTTATFSQPGDYWLRANATEGGGEGGGGSGQCCTTSALVRVTVK